jgi:hypothetical protein
MGTKPMSGLIDNENCPALKSNKTPENQPKTGGWLE